MGESGVLTCVEASQRHAGPNGHLTLLGSGAWLWRWGLRRAPAHRGGGLMPEVVSYIM